MCDDICLINKGQIVLEGNLKEIKTNYGLKTVEVEYLGEKSTLEELQSVKILELNDQKLLAELLDDISINDVLKELIARVTVKGFKVNEPSLEQIFIEQVRN
jgi:ABC-2 type transport system ATP-binding protein